MTPSKDSTPVADQPTEILLADDPGSSGLRLFGSHGHVNVPAHVAADGSGQLIKLAGLRQRKPPHEGGAVCRAHALSASAWHI